MLRLSSILNSV